MALLLSNAWMYNTIDNAVGHRYYQTSCGEWELDAKELQKGLVGKTRIEALQFLNEHQMKFDSFQKGDEFVVSMHSFQLIYDSNGKLTETNTH